ncbi:MAG: hypothetical protein ABEJ07_06120 [Candidatus Nanohaloarchaea archaeon]
MVYEKECAECGKLIDFGGRDRERLPENAVEFDGKIYCRECVKDFVQFGTGDVMARIEKIEEALKEIEDELGLERHLDMSG